MLVRQFQFDYRFSVYFILAGQFDLVAFALIVHQRPIEIRFIGNAAQLIRFHRLHVFVGRKWINYPPCGLSVINAHHRLSADGNFHVHFPGPFKLHFKRTVRAGTERNLTGDFLSLNRFDLIRAASTFATKSSAV